MSKEANLEALPVGFRDVDATAPDKILHCLQTLSTIEAVRAYKARALDFLDLRFGATALDVACGLGGDVEGMRGRGALAFGADLSRSLLAPAGVKHPACRFVQADASRLPFADGTFDAVRVDRSLQHIDGPGRVVREMARVARKGGVVLCAEPDWGTFLLGGTHSAITERIQRDWIASFRNPWIGRELSTLLAEAGVVDLRWSECWLPTRGFADSDTLFEVAATAGKLAAEMPESLTWLDGYRKGEAYAGVLMLTCWGRKA